VCKEGITSEQTFRTIDGVPYHTSCSARLKSLTAPMMSDSFRGEPGHEGIIPQEELGKPHAAHLSGCRNPVCLLQKDMNRALAMLDELAGPQASSRKPEDIQSDAQTLLLKHGYYAMDKAVSVTDVTEAR
jgi:hypothetical protein